ncbi:MAG: RagB/SusD family nutrient uptake outer membrane protein [Chitinophagaceae bacterium]|nr:RagB/SusD family nutrient uptake outer membrane protein [Chitinophagaceae bacterium]
MLKINFLSILILLLVVVITPSCEKNYGNLNNPTVEDYLKNATKDQLNNLVSGTESSMRNELGLYLDDVGVLGREMYRFSGADPRYTTDLLGAADATLNNTGFYITNVWSAKYRVVKNCNVLIEAVNNSTLVSASEKKGYQGFAKTIKAYELLLLLNLTGKNGIRIDVADPSAPGPIVGYDESLTQIAALFEEAKTDLSSADISFPLSSGFTGFKTAEGLIKFNRALAARVAVYREKWQDALDYLDESFYNPSGSLVVGIYHVFSTGSGDQLNSAFFPQNQAGEVRVAHPSYATDIEGGDDRIEKATLRETPASNTGLTSNRDVWVYTSSTAAAPVIRNEELILIKAEAELQLQHFSDARDALNIIRNAHGLGNYGGALNEDELTDEMLEQRRYSLFFEGHRWIDMRRYNRIDELPIDRQDDNRWTEFPLPNTER